MEVSRTNVVEYERPKQKPLRRRLLITGAVALFAIGGFAFLWGVVFTSYVVFIPHWRDSWGAEFIVFPFALAATAIGLILVAGAAKCWRRAR
jgi:predicted membrane chloride channel (bestrophin family)